MYTLAFIDRQIEVGSEDLLGSQMGTMRCKWSNVWRPLQIWMHSCRLESKVNSMRYQKACPTGVIPLCNFHGFFKRSFLFCLQLCQTQLSSFVFVPCMKTVPKTSSQALDSDMSIRYAANPVGIFNYATLDTYSSNYCENSALCLLGSFSCDPRDSQGTAGMDQGSWDPWPP